QEGGGVPSAADGGVEHHPRRDGQEGLDDLVDHDRPVLERRCPPSIAAVHRRRGGSPIGCPPDGGAGRDVSPIRLMASAGGVGADSTCHPKGSGWANPTPPSWCRCPS